MSDTVLTFKKKGFFIAIEKDQNPVDRYKDTLAALETEGQALINAAITELQERERVEKEITNSLVNRVAEMYEKRIRYEEYLQQRKEERVLLTEQIKNTCTELYETLSLLGQKKANVVSQQLESIRKEIAKITETYDEIAGKQNSQFQQIFQADQPIIRDKIEYWKKRQADVTLQHAAVLERIKNLSRDGVNPMTARYLLNMGWLAAFIAGWFFSIWAIPDSGLTGSTNFKFFFIEHIGQFLSRFNWLWTFAGVIIYVIVIGLISWAAHSILVQNKWAGKKQQEEFIFDSDDENLLRVQLRKQPWWSLWLRLAPLIIVIVPLIAVITTELNANTASGTGAPGFQGLFNDFFLQLIGTLIAACSSVFMLFYLTRVSEKSYHADETGRRGRFSIKVFHAGFILFALMIGLMFYYQQTAGTAIGPDMVQAIAIAGFAVSCLTTAFSLGYGYIFKGLQDNLGFLITGLRLIANHIERLSKPDRRHYTHDEKFIRRIDQLQEKMFELIRDKHGRTAGLLRLKKEERENPPASARNGSRNLFLRWWKQLSLQRELLPATGYPATEHFEESFRLSGHEQIYFAEECQKIEALSNRIKEERAKIRAIDKEWNSFWRNEETYQSVNDQLKHAENELVKRKEDWEERKVTLQQQINSVKKSVQDNMNALSEGFYTGRWFGDGDEPGGTKLLEEKL